jgi:predicted RNase H-like nuclease
VFVGVDGCAQGWVVLALSDEGFTTAQLLPDFDAVVAAYGEADAIGVDMPIGLTDEASRGADRAARAFLKGQASSIFNAPVRAALRATSYEEAKRICLEVSGKALSRQSFGILPKIQQVDRHAGDARIVEVHPEVSFRLMNDGQRLPRKKSWGGLQQRLTLLQHHGIELPSFGSAVDDVGIDDMVDAAAAAWSARRVARGEARSFPAEVVVDPEHGRRIAIWG